MFLLSHETIAYVNDKSFAAEILTWDMYRDGLIDCRDLKAAYTLPIKNNQL